MTVYVGIDVHKRFCQASIMDDNGAILRELKFENTLERAYRLVNLAKSINPNVKAVLEPSARSKPATIVLLIPSLRLLFLFTIPITILTLRFNSDSDS